MSLSLRTGIPPSVLEQEEDAMLMTMLDLLAPKKDDEGVPWPD